MTSQSITPELRAWIVSQAQAGHGPEALLTSMRASGWEEDAALQAMETALSGFLAEQHKAGGPPVPIAVPDIAQPAGVNVLDAGDREVRVVMAMRNPRVVVVSGLLSDDECDELVALAAPRMARSETVDVATGGNEVNAARTSRGMFFERGENEVARKLEARIAKLLDWPVDHGEGLQVLHYGPGAEYRPHHDYFDPAQPGSVPILKRGGQRVATVVTYLNTPLAGGGTTFPDVALEVAPLKGHAVFFSYDRPHPITRTLHGGAPVVEGEKWVATKWLRERVFK
ncbi:2OG-Fe(II) oxygenase [Aquincola tertiaricarbonis]|mgnify:FL=1|uniref:2OG-Fe(II) oxygenase n=1 Tax=Aquincola tertiaricarbonis TaxID=391953 RepID=A0ABY4S4F2_AQUTE|nr:2OG-Fe(II) oxygenase [Aquincola tertiaricarbonis]URI06887.1 2OG-Fe(II) oxygenase [Aquincola tertiaricarbonis]